MEINELWPLGPTYEGESVQTDALSLCRFAQAPKNALCADLGTGCGILPLLLLREHPLWQFDAVELRSQAAALAQANLERNGLSPRGRVHVGDMREMRLPMGRYDLVLSNPPYFPADFRKSENPDRALMRQESLSLPELCRLAASLLKNGGRFTLCYPASRCGELFAALQGAGLRIKRLRCVQHSSRHAPSLLLCESRKNVGEGIQWEPPLLLRGEDGSESEEYKELCHRQ